MHIGERIKQLRKENDMTQEKVADYLSITYQAVSKWENGTAMPDITMLVPLANLFGVSTDRLLGLEDGKEEEEIKSAEKTLVGRAKEEQLAIWRQLCLKYPKNHYAKLMVAKSLCIGIDRKNGKDNTQELIEVQNICYAILEECTEDSIRSQTIRQLSAAFEFEGEPRKAQEVAKMAPSILESRELLLSALAFGVKEQGERYWKQVSIDKMLGHLMRCLLNQPYHGKEEAYVACKAVIALLDALFEERTCLKYEWEYADTYLYMAQCLASMDRKEEVIEVLKKAKTHVERYNAIPVGTYTFEGNLFLDEITYTRVEGEQFLSWGNKTFKEWLEQKDFDSIREHSNFKKLLQ
ncbi:MAG: helix-turn-helix domain-containing protein [Cellulosilyticaceae bacterium]